jgi:hypothetical protein
VNYSLARASAQPAADGVGKMLQRGPDVAARRLVTSIEIMAKKHRGDPHRGEVGHWKGDAVERRPDDEAEASASRAEGNEPISTSAESERLAHGDLQSQPRGGQRRPPHAEDPEEETAEAAEAHQQRDAIERPPRGKL